MAIYADDGNGNGSAIPSRDDYEREWRNAEASANASLIGAAPDGLEVASDLCAILDEHCAHDGEALVYDHEAIGEEMARLHEKLTAFIAKARGEAADILSGGRF